MKISFLLLLILFNCNSICLNPYERIKDYDKEKKECDKFIYTMRLQASQLYHLAKECNVEHNKNSCNEILTIKKTLKEGTRIHGQRDFLLEYYIIFLHESYSFNRRELYEHDLDVLEKYRVLLPEEWYSLLSDFEKDSALTNNECVFKHNMQACKKPFVRSAINKEVLANLRELKENDPFLYNVLLDYLIESLISKIVNTKTRFMNNREDYIKLIERLDSEDSAEKAKFKAMANELKKRSDNRFEFTLSHKEIRQKLEEVIDSNESDSR